MARELISKRTRTSFREAFVGWTLREIGDEFDAEGFTADTTYVPPVGGARRSFVEQYYHRIDFGRLSDVTRLLAVYQEVLLRLQREASGTGWQRAAAQRRLDELLLRLKQDGFVFADGRILSTASSLHDAQGIASRIDAPELNRQIERIRDSVEDDPALAVGTAKELVETVCKTILGERGVAVDPDWDVARLMKETRTVLRLLPEHVSDSSRGVDAIKKVLGSLSTIAHGLSELRNLYGTGHGRGAKARGVLPRHARLAVGAATTLAVFMFETHASTQGVTKGESRTA